MMRKTEYAVLAVLVLLLTAACGAAGGDGGRANRLLAEGRRLCAGGDMKGGILKLKDAEHAADLRDTALMIKIWSSLAEQNMGAEAYRLALGYSEKALRYAGAADSVEAEVYALNVMANSYAHLNKADSSRQAMLRSIPLVNRLPRNMRSVQLNNIAKMVSSIDLDMAERFVNEAAKYGADAYTSVMRAMLYCERGQNKAALRELEAAPLSDNIIIRCDRLRLLCAIMKSEGRYEEAFTVQQELTHLSDSMELASNERSLRDIQADYDRRMERVERQQLICVVAVIVALMAAAAAGLTLYFRYKLLRTRHLLEIDRQTIKAHNVRIDELERAAAESEKTRADNLGEIKRLRKEISVIEERHSGRLADGCRCYAEVLAEKPTVRWTKDNFMNFVEYYKLIDPAMVRHLETDYSGLTYKTMTFAIMESIFKNDAKVADMMCASPGALRTMRSRMEKKRVTNE